MLAEVGDRYRWLHQHWPDRCAARLAEPACLAGAFVSDQGFHGLVLIDVGIGGGSPHRPSGAAPVELLLSCSWPTEVLPRLDEVSVGPLTTELSRLGFHLRCEPGGLRVQGSDAALATLLSDPTLGPLTTAFNAMEFLAHRLRARTTHPVYAPLGDTLIMPTPEGGPIFGPPKDFGNSMATTLWHPRLHVAK